jgi:hypothetical protein
MRVRGEISTGKVWLNDKEIILDGSIKLTMSSPLRFAWGYNGSNPAILSFAILMVVTGNESFSVVHYDDFMWSFVSRWPLRDFEIVEDIEGWIEERRSLRDIPIEDSS